MSESFMHIETMLSTLERVNRLRF